LQVSGIADGASTIQFKLTVVAKKSSKYLSFSSINLKDGEADVRVYKKTGPLTFSSDFEKGDTLSILASQIYPHTANKQSAKDINNNDSEAGLNRDKGNKCKGEASLTYHYRGKQRSFCIEKMDKLQNLYMP
jgi:hypothetical protein